MADLCLQGDSENPDIDVPPVTLPPPPINSQDAPNSTQVDLTISQDVAIMGTNDNVDTEKRSTGKGEKTGKIRSKIWDQYNKETIDGKLKARCKHCIQLLLGDPKQGTSHLKKYFERCPRRKIKDIRQQVLQANANKGKTKLSPYDFDQEASRKILAKMVIMHEYPLKMAEHEGFNEFVKSLNPCFNLVTRNTLKNDCLKLYEGLKEVVMHNFESCESRVAITIDMWTSSHQKKGFMVVTAHFIDNCWKLQSRIIRFIYVPSPHTSENLCEAIVECFLDWNIDRKLSTVTMDNCTTNDAMIKLLLEKLSIDSLLIGGRLLHMRCSAHILNLIVKDGLDVIGDAIDKVRDSVSYWSGTPKRWEKFEDTARRLCINLGKKLLLDCKTRWNSTY